MVRTSPSSLLYYFLSATSQQNHGGPWFPRSGRVDGRLRWYHGHGARWPWVNPERLWSAQGGQGRPRGARGTGGKVVRRGLKLCRLDSGKVRSSPRRAVISSFFSYSIYILQVYSRLDYCTGYSSTTVLYCTDVADLQYSTGRLAG